MGDWIELADPAHEEAIDAMIIAFQHQGVRLVDLIRPKDELSQQHLRIVLGSALSAGVGRLTSESDVRVDAAYQRGVEAGRTQVPPIDYPADWAPQSREAERRHRERMASISADEAFRRGVAIGKAETEARAIDGQLVTSGPSEYDPAIEALHAAVRLVKPIEGVSGRSPEVLASLADGLAHTTTAIADRLVQWLSEHIDDDGVSADGAIYDPTRVPPLAESGPDPYTDRIS